MKQGATATTPGQGIYRKGNRRSDSIRNNKFIECNDSPELNWGIELKLEASPTAPSKKQLNAESGQKDSTEPALNFRKLLYISQLLEI